MQNAGVCEVLFDVSMTSKLVNRMAQKEKCGISLVGYITGKFMGCKFIPIGIITDKLNHMCSAIYICMYVYMRKMCVYC